MPTASILLGLAICAVWLPDLRFQRIRIPPWTLVLTAAVVAGLRGGVLDWRGGLVVSAFCALAFASTKSHSASARSVLTAVVVVIAFALASQLVPGFQPSVLIDGVQVSPDAPPMRLTAHFAPGVAGLVLVAFYCRRARTLRELAAIALPTTVVAVVTTVAVIGVSWAAGYVRPDWKLPYFTAAHLAKILLWTTVLEEGFFRGFLQDRLARSTFVRTRPRLAWVPIAVSSILFGIAHFPGGWVFVGLATLAGVGYGIAYARTGLIEAAMATHFLVNATHFVAFTYPQIARG